MVLLRSKMGFSLVELLVVIAIVGILLALLLPAVQAAREAGRRCQCANNVRQTALAVQQYATAHRVFPAGCVIDASYRLRSTPWYDVWHEATEGNQGTSWMLMVLPYLEQSALYDQWDFHKNVKDNQALASTDISMFYCPSRRSGIRSGDRDLMFEKWESGGTDYGGCMTRGNGFFNSSPFAESGQCGHFLSPHRTVFNSDGSNAGILAPNTFTPHAAVRDGLSNTLLVGELERSSIAQTLSVSTENCKALREDGWAAGGVNCLFSTDRLSGGLVSPGSINNGFFESAGSEHPGGAHFAMADGSLRWIADHVDPILFEYLGSRADGEIAILP